MTADRPRILLGHIAGVHGVRGDVLVRSYTEPPENIATYGTLSDEHGRHVYTLKIVSTAAKGLVARIGGVEDRSAAEALKGLGLYVARDQLPPPDDDAYYHADLVGLVAVDESGTRFGTIVSIQNYGAGDLLEIALDGKRTTELVPFSNSFVPRVDLDRREATVILPMTMADDEDDPSK